MGMHISSHLIPTVEREKLDFQDPYISEWNKELLLSTGQIARFLYDQTMNQISSKTKITEKEIFLSMAPFSFQSNVLEDKIGLCRFNLKNIFKNMIFLFLGDTIQSGFFHKTTELIVPVRHSPSDSNISFVSSQEAYLTQSEDIQTFLTLPLVPFELSKSYFFQTIRKRQLIRFVNNQIIEQRIPKTILLVDELINLIRWLCKNKESIKYILKSIHYRETIDSPTIKLTNIQYYISKLNIPSVLPLPSTVLPSNVIRHFSSNELNQQLLLSEYNLKDLIKYYLDRNQKQFLENCETSAYIFSLISQNLNRYKDDDDDDEWNNIKLILSKIKCISTNQGMKIPDKSFIPSTILSSSTLPIINYKLIQNSEDNLTDNKQSIDTLDNLVSVEFLMRVGCHSFHLQSFINARSISSNGNVKTLIQQLIKERKNMTDADFDSLKKNKWLEG